MSTKAPMLAAVAVDALTRALMHAGSYSWWKDRPLLEVHAASEAVARAPLAVLTNSTAEEWDGEEMGLPFRTCRGTLPCGLPLEVVTFRDEVPDLLGGTS